MKPDRKSAARIACLFVATLLSLITVFNQVKAAGLGWQEDHYFPALQTIAHGDAGPPEQSRILSNVPLYLLCEAAIGMGIPRPVGVTFVAVRLAQNIVIFLLALVYWRRLGVSAYLGLLGLSALAWGMTHANHGSFLDVDAYTDIILYLLGAFFLVARRPGMIVPITLLGTLNRETIGLLPLMACSASFLPTLTRIESARFWRAGITALVVFGVTLYVARSPFGGLLASVQLPELEMVAHNLRSGKTWLHWFGVWGIVPIIAFARYRTWSPMLRAFLPSLIPVWITLHWLYTPVAQAQFLLLPLVVVLLPAALLTVQSSRDGQNGRP